MKILVLLILFFTGTVFADTYSAISSKIYLEGYCDPGYATSGACIAAAIARIRQNNNCTPTYPNGTYCPVSGVFNWESATQFSFHGVSYEGTYAANYLGTVTTTFTCPAGGTVSGTNCINAPACPAGDYRDTETHICTTPVFCLYPEVDDGTGHCAVPAECSAGKKYQYSTLSCVTPPTCAATEAFNAYTWACELKKLNCPGHTHANTANDACLSDAPLTCPVGQHDDGTYLCIANDAVGCTSGQVKGYIFGIPQCINKVNVDEFAKQAADVAATKVASDARVAASQAVADAAAAELAADPTNTVKQEANNAAQAANAVELATQSTDSKASDQAQKNQDSAALKAISDSVKNMDDKDDSDRAAGFGTVPGPDVIGTSAISLDSIPIGSSSGVCPAPFNIVTSHGTISMSYQSQCDFAVAISPLVLIFAYFSAGMIVLGPLRG